MANRWQLAEELKAKYLPVVQEFIDKVEATEFAEDLELELSDTGLSPYTLIEMLESLGYEKGDMDTNGWQMDYWFPMEKSGFKKLSIDGTAITFTLNLTVRG